LADGGFGAFMGGLSDRGGILSTLYPTPEIKSGGAQDRSGELQGI